MQEGLFFLARAQVLPILPAVPCTPGNDVKNGQVYRYEFSTGRPYLFYHTFLETRQNPSEQLLVINMQP